MHFSRARRSRNRVFAHFRRVLPRFADFQRVFRGFFDFFTDFRDFRHVPEAIRAVFSFRASKLRQLAPLRIIFTVNHESLARHKLSRGKV